MPLDFLAAARAASTQISQSPYVPTSYTPPSDTTASALSPPSSAVASSLSGPSSSGASPPPSSSTGPPSLTAPAPSRSRHVPGPSVVPVTFVSPFAPSATHATSVGGPSSSGPSSVGASSSTDTSFVSAASSSLAGPLCFYTPIPFVPRSGPLAIPGSSSTGASSATCTSSASAPSSSTTGPPPLLVASAPSQPRYAPEAVPLVSPSIPLLVPDILKPSTKGQQTPRADKKTKQETRKRKNVENWDEQGKVVRSDTLAPEETGRKKKRARMDAPTEEDVTIVTNFKTESVESF